VNRLVIVSGLSGAGKTTTLHSLEDLGFFAVDNAPPSLWADLIKTLEAAAINDLAVAIDIRAEVFVDVVPDEIRVLRNQGHSIEVFFLDAANDILVGRFNLTRRNHPLNETGLSEDLNRERIILSPIRLLADTILDTSSLSAEDLTKQVRLHFKDEARFTLRVVSFGYKYGVPRDADIVLDVRTMPNPYYDLTLRSLPGTHPSVQTHVFSEEGVHFYNSLRDTVLLLVKRSEVAGRQGYTVAIGCTGGQHRSPAVVERLGRELTSYSGLQFTHRDLPKAQGEHSK
jgi:UPF0042 nucleotide-binding protein